MSFLLGSNMRFRQNSFIKVLPLIFLFTIGYSYSQSFTVDPVSNLTISDGLAHNGISCLLEDSRGYIWIGTYDGLNKYDGVNFETFKNSPDHELIASNRVRSLAEDSKGNIWVGTDDGITVYNFRTKQFKLLFTNKNRANRLNGPIVRSIIVNKKDSVIICATEQEGVLIFNSDYKLLKRLQPFIGSSKNKIMFHEGISLEENRLVFATSVGLLQFHWKQNRWKQILGKEIPASISVTKLSHKQLGIALNSGIAIVNINTREGGTELVKKVLIYREAI